MPKFDSERAPLSDVKELRARARQHVESGAVTAGYRADREKVVELLNAALATEIVCVLRYRRHYFMSSGLASEPVAAEFLEHANEEQAHADLLAQRITELNGEPDFDPDTLAARAHSEYVEGSTLRQMIAEDLVAERVAIESYTEMIRFIGDDDPTTRRLLETILAKEEEHANDLTDLMSSQGKMNPPPTDRPGSVIDVDRPPSSMEMPNGASRQRPN